MKVIIAGSRNMPSTAKGLIPEAVKASGFTVTEVVCGMARGADLFGMKWAVEQGIDVAKFPANWEKYGNAAGPIRNRQMAEYADALLVFIWKDSRGSANMLKTMKSLNKPCFVVRDGELP